MFKQKNQSLFDKTYDHIDQTEAFQEAFYELFKSCLADYIKQEEDELSELIEGFNTYFGKNSLFFKTPLFDFSGDFDIDIKSETIYNFLCSYCENCIKDLQNLTSKKRKKILIKLSELSKKLALDQLDKNIEESSEIAIFLENLQENLKNIKEETSKVASIEIKKAVSELEKKSIMLVLFCNKFIESNLDPTILINFFSCYLDLFSKPYYCNLEILFSCIQNRQNKIENLSEYRYFFFFLYQKTVVIYNPYTDLGISKEKFIKYNKNGNYCTKRSKFRK
jgi:hypothetical protein